MTKSRIAICLYKEEIKAFDYAKFFAGSLSTIALKSNHPDIHLYQRKSDPHPAAWVEAIKKFSKAKDSDLQTASAGAILILKVKKRYFGCCFGTSVANINRENIEPDFGLAAAFRRMTRTDLKAVQSFSLSSNPITNQRVSTLPTLRDNFNIDSLSENITELEGYSRQGLNKTLIKGKEFYSCPIIESLDDATKLCQQLLLDYQNALTQKDFNRLTASRKVKDKKLVEALNEELCDKVMANDTSVFLNDYEHFSDIGSYRLSDGTTAAELSLVQVLGTYKPGKTIDIDTLKGNRIIPLDLDGNPLGNWSLYKTLFIEVDSGVKKYVLFKSVWYELDRSYISSLQSFLDNYHFDPKTKLPKWNGTDSENAYNNKASTKLSGQLWDTELFTHEDYKYGIEFCDVLSNDFIIAAKKYKSSSLNSHLLMQTAVALQLLDSNDESFLDWLKSMATDQFGGTNLIGTDVSKIKKEKTIIILLLSNEKKKASEILPFFSLVAFKLVLTKLTNMGFKVKVAVV